MKNPLTAFLLSFIPGVGHAYLGRPVRFFVYALGFFGPIAALMLIYFIHHYIGNGTALILFMISICSAIVNLFDMIITLVSGKYMHAETAAAGGQVYSSDFHASTYPAGSTQYYTNTNFEHIAMQQQEQTKIMLLSIIPGLGHMNMGLMKRGITLMTTFVGLFALIIFFSLVLSTSVYLVFFLALPIIWLYGLFDVVACIQAKQNGERVEDRSIFEEAEKYMSAERKSKTVALSLAIFPGAGHIYLGLKNRGIQIMIGLVVLIFIADSLRLNIFLFLLPLLWLFAFMDTLHSVSEYKKGELQDRPIIKQIEAYRGWLGAMLILLGIYYLFDQVMMWFIQRTWFNFYVQYLSFKFIIPVALSAIFIIGIGAWLAFGKEKSPK